MRLQITVLIDPERPEDYGMLTWACPVCAATERDLTLHRHNLSNLLEMAVVHLRTEHGLV